MTATGTAKRIDGKKLAAQLVGDLATQIAQLSMQGVRPGLAVIQVGDDAASAVYVRNKRARSEQAGMLSRSFEVPAATTQEELLRLVDKLNHAPEIHGILVQLPLPPHLDAAAALAAIAPAKDVDGFHAVNAGLLALGQDGLVPCTPLGCMKLLEHSAISLRGRRALVIGRSNIVGKPMAQLLLAADCTVTIAHRYSEDLARLCREADIVVAAVGRPELVRGAWLKPGATVIDVGINRVTRPDGGTRLVGDVAFGEACTVAGAITPVPGGVGPMTIACLLANTVDAARRIHGIGP